MTKFVTNAFYLNTHLSYASPLLGKKRKIRRNWRFGRCMAALEKGGRGYGESCQKPLCVKKSICESPLSHLQKSKAKKNIS